MKCYKVLSKILNRQTITTLKSFPHNFSWIHVVLDEQERRPPVPPAGISKEALNHVPQRTVAQKLEYKRMD